MIQEIFKFTLPQGRGYYPQRRWFRKGGGDTQFTPIPSVHVHCETEPCMLKFGPGHIFCFYMIMRKIITVQFFFLNNEQVPEGSQFCRRIFQSSP